MIIVSDHSSLHRISFIRFLEKLAAISTFNGTSSVPDQIMFLELSRTSCMNYSAIDDANFELHEPLIFLRCFFAITNTLRFPSSLISSVEMSISVLLMI